MSGHTTSYYKVEFFAIMKIHPFFLKQKFLNYITVLWETFLKDCTYKKCREFDFNATLLGIKQAIFSNMLNFSFLLQRGATH